MPFYPDIIDAAYTALETQIAAHPEWIGATLTIAGVLPEGGLVVKLQLRNSDWIWYAWEPGNSNSLGHLGWWRDDRTSAKSVLARMLPYDPKMADPLTEHHAMQEALEAMS